MKKKKITLWNYGPQMEDMLFFASILDEMTFNYTLDSFKASVHNIFSLIRECIETINDIEEETIKPLRDQIFAAATTDNHVLLRYRLYKLNDRMGSVKNVKSTYKKFQERMKWHVTRLYRTRNLIVHAGTRPRYLDLLLENIHSFYDTFMRELIVDITDKGMKKLEYSYILRQSRHNNYLNYLESLNNATVIDENNFADVMGLH